MLNTLARASVSKVTEPIGRGLLRIGLTPDVITVVGTLGVVAGSVGLIATGELFWGTVVVTVFVLFDLFDGAMARVRGFGTPFGVVLDASCDRIADAALFGSIAYYSFAHLGSRELGIAALIALGSGQVVSYIKARADSVALHIKGAIAERAERNVLGLVATGLAGLGLPRALDVLIWILAAAAVVTVIQRLVQVSLAATAAGHGAVAGDAAVADDAVGPGDAAGPGGTSQRDGGDSGAAGQGRADSAR